MENEFVKESLVDSYEEEITKLDSIVAQQSERIKQLKKSIQLSESCCELYRQKYLYELSKRHRIEESVFGLFKLSFKTRLKFLFMPNSLDIKQLMYFNQNEDLEEN